MEFLNRNPPSARQSRRCSKNSTLTDLELSWNFIAAGFTAAIARALGDNDALKELNVSHNAFHDTDHALPAQEIGRSLRRNTGLIRLDLR